MTQRRHPALHKILLAFADLFGLGRHPGPGSSLIFFSAWPKNQRARYWASDMEKVIILGKKQPVNNTWYDLRFFLKNGSKTDHTVSEDTLRKLQNTRVQFTRSPRFEESELQKSA